MRNAFKAFLVAATATVLGFSSVADAKILTVGNYRENVVKADTETKTCAFIRTTPEGLSVIFSYNARLHTMVVMIGGSIIPDMTGVDIPFVIGLDGKNYSWTGFGGKGMFVMVAKHREAPGVFIKAEQITGYINTTPVFSFASDVHFDMAMITMVQCSESLNSI